MVFATFCQLFLIKSFSYLLVTITWIRAWMASKFGKIRSGTTELAALEHLKIDVAPFSRFTVSPGKKSGERLQDHWSSDLSFALKQEVHSSHELFVFAKWTNQVLFGLVYRVSVI